MFPEASVGGSRTSTGNSAVQGSAESPSAGSTPRRAAGGLGQELCKEDLKSTVAGWEGQHRCTERGLD